MSSIIKVDQIQLANGSTPTAADLGLNTTGSVLQVVQDRITGNVSTTSSSLQDSGLVVSITPSSTSSKILVIAYSTNIVTQDGGQLTGEIQSQIGGGGYSTLQGFGGDAGAGATNNYIGSIYSSFLHSPNTTSQVDYKVKFRNSGGGGTVFLVGYTTQHHGITLMEIAG